MKEYPESRLTDLLIEFDEMGFCPTTVCPHPEQYAIEWKEQIVKEIQKLQAENVELAKLCRGEKGEIQTAEQSYEICAEIVKEAKAEMKTREEQIAEMAKEMRNYGYKHLCAGRVFYYGFCEHLYDAGYRKRDEVIKDVFEGLIEKTKAVQRAGYDGLGVEDLKNIAKLWYGAEVEE